MPVNRAPLAAFPEDIARSDLPSAVEVAPRPIIRSLFYVFIFSLPFEALDLGTGAALSKIVGYVFLLATLSQPQICFRRPPVAFWCFGAYLIVFAVLGLFQSSVYENEILERFLTLTQLLGLFLIGYNLTRYEDVARGAMITLAIACVTVSLLHATGVAAEPKGTGTEAERMTALGQNANRLAGMLSIGLLGLMGLTYGPGKTLIRPRLLVWPFFVLLGFSVVLTGSRGGLLALVGGLLAFMLRGGTLQTRMRNLLIAFLVMGFLVAVSLQLEFVRQRWERSLTTGHMAGREALYPAATQMFLERPLTGWGPIRHLYELGYRVRYVQMGHDPHQPWRDTHNIFLYVLTQVGLLGSLPFFAGLWLCVHASWRAARSAWGVAPFAMTVTLLIVNTSGTLLHFKLHWFTLALVLACGSKSIGVKLWPATAPPEPLASRFPAPAAT